MGKNIIRIRIISCIFLMAIINNVYSQAFTKYDPIGTVIEYQKGSDEDNIEQMTLVDKELTSKGVKLKVRIGDDESFYMQYILTKDALIWHLDNMKKMMKKALGDTPYKVRFSVNGDDIIIPMTPHVGEKYKDLKFKIVPSLYGIKPKVNFTIHDRKILRKESIETPLGTFDAYVYSSTWDLHIKLLLLINEKEQFNITQWIVPGLGVVKESSIDEEDSSSSVTKTLVRKHIPSVLH